MDMYAHKLTQTHRHLYISTAYMHLIYFPLTVGGGQSWWWATYWIYHDATHVFHTIMAFPTGQLECKGGLALISWTMGFFRTGQNRAVRSLHHIKIHTAFFSPMCQPWKRKESRKLLSQESTSLPEETHCAGEKNTVKRLSEMSGFKGSESILHLRS